MCVLDFALNEAYVFVKSALLLGIANWKVLEFVYDKIITFDLVESEDCVDQRSQEFSTKIYTVFFTFQFPIFHLWFSIEVYYNLFL